MANHKCLTYGIFVLIIVGIIFVVSQKELDQSQELSLSYHYTTEGAYYDVKIEGLRITLTHTDYEKIKEKCAQWVQQSPCWTEEDLIAEEAQLTNQEIIDLQNLISETKIIQLENYYGPEQGERCYPYTLRIDEKEITYCSSPDGPARPKAFSEVSQKIQEIVIQKF